MNLAWLLTGEGAMFLPAEEEGRAAARPSLDALVATKEELGELDSRLRGNDKRLEEKADKEDLEHTAARLEALREIVLRQHPEEEETGEIGEQTVLYEIGAVAAGAPISLADFDPSETVRVAGRYHPQQHFVCKVVGASMVRAGIQPGDRVILEQCDTPIHAQIMLCYYDGQTTLKQLWQQEDGNWQLRYRDATRRRIIPRKGEDWHVLGRFVQVARVLEGEALGG